MASKVERRAAVLQKEYEKLEGVSPALAKLLGQQFAFLETLLVGQSSLLMSDEDKTRIQELVITGKIQDALTELEELRNTDFRAGEIGLTGIN